MAFVARRLSLAAVVLAAFSFASFWFFASKDPVLKGHSALSEYGTWVRGLGSGRSYRALLQPTRSLWTIDAPALGHTAALLAGTFVVVVALSLAVGVAAARWRGSAVDLLVRTVSYVAWAVPAFLLALAVQEAVGALGGGDGIGPFPIAGWPGSCPAGIGINAGSLSSCPAAGSGALYVLNMLRYLALPTFTLGVGFVGLHGRYLRSALLETLDAPFITTARAKGLSERHVVLRHALRASLSTFVGALLSDFGVIFGAALAVDWVFQLNGIGSAFIRQFPTTTNAPIDTYSVQLVLVLTGVFVLVASVLSEIAVAWLDPRVRETR